jgi:hypothetical protein
MSDYKEDDDRAGGGARGTTVAEAPRRGRGEAHRDPLTGEPGSHPVGMGIGAAGGAVAGAAIGAAVGGPAGAVVGAAVGGGAGGLAGKGIAESLNPAEEDAFWRAEHPTRPYARGRSYESFRPAYRYGWESRGRYAGRPWEEAERDLERGWEQARGTSNLAWSDARSAAQDAWNRIDERYGRRFDDAEDRYWRENYTSRPYAAGRAYEDLQPAYAYGYESCILYRGADWDTVSGDLARGWGRASGKSKSTWQEVKHAVRDGWNRAARLFKRTPEEEPVYLP